jgi:hypothetical protein
MMPWARASFSEDNFLERLMPDLRREKSERMESCPDAQLLAAFVDEEVSPTVKQTVTAHLAQCAGCSEICARLVSFAQPQTQDAEGQNAEWPNADKRLQNWMDGFLASQAVAGFPPAAEKPQLVPGNVLPKRSSWWGLPWALGSATAVLAILVGGALIAERTGWISTPRQLAKVQIPPPPVLSAPSVGSRPTAPWLALLPAESSAKPSPGTENKVAPKPQASDHPQTASSFAPRNLRSESPDQAAHVYSAPGRPNDRIAAGIGSIPPEGSNPTANPASTNHGASEVARMPSRPVAPNDSIVATGNAPTPAPSRQPTVYGAHATVPSYGTGASGASKYGRLNAASAARLPQNVRIAAGTRLMISTHSLHPQQEGSFEFQGFAVQPIPGNDPAWSAVFAKGTFVSGAGIIQHDRVKLFITRLIMKGVTYNLQGSPSKWTDNTPGTAHGQTLTTEQMLEVWLSWDAVYEKQAEAPPSQSSSVPNP